MISFTLYVMISDYPNGAVIKRVTACKYSKYETPSEEDKEYKNTYCPHSSILCPKQEPQYHVPVSLTRRGLQVNTLLYIIFGHIFFMF